MDNMSDSDISEWVHLSDSSINCLPRPSALHTYSSVIPNSMKELLLDKVFVGEYTERHYVDQLSKYRDLIVINSDEVELFSCIKEVIKIVDRTYGKNIWFGVTDNEHDGTPEGCCLWVNISQIPLGKHWFQIQSINLRDGEISLRLRHLRSFEANQSQSTVKYLRPDELIENFDIKQFVQDLKWSKVRDIVLEQLVYVSAWSMQNFKNVVTYENIRETVKFCSVLLLFVASFLVETSKFICDYSLKFFREFSNVIRSLTPIVLGIIDFLAKCVGGFYLLLVMLWRGSSGPPIPANAISAAFNKDDSGWSHRKGVKTVSSFRNSYAYGQRVPQPRGKFSAY